MAEPDSSHGFDGAEGQGCADFSAEMAAAQRQQLRDQRSRIRDLEQALDQSIANLNQLRSQITNQQFLEHQLASTEEIANVQQQAIHQLKRQFAEKQAALEQEICDLQARSRDHQMWLETAETPSCEPKQLGLQLAYDRAVAQFHSESQPTSETLRSELETARSQIASLETQLNDAQKQIMRLYRELSDRHTAIHELEARLEGDFWAIEPFSPAPASETSHPSGKVEDLEAQVAKQMANQVLLQQACQELEVDRELNQTRIAELERQSAEMQEQILSQAQQASEYQAAVQHWKDRFYNTQDKVSRLKELLDAFPDLPPEVTEIFGALQAAERLEVGRSTLKTEPPNPDKIDLPDFLTRRRTYRNRS
ncbi:MAG: hypothetical protein HC780_25650 [Leptolyngbyaceae cyanobacterium CSU_1_3]|nr:hypothetical protein [Leptolyngbyaceae cyanobacterium CSU_1_3]